jgi:phosphate transport system substrate-binding protein
LKSSALLCLALSLCLLYPPACLAVQRPVTVCGTGDSQKLLLLLGAAFTKEHHGTAIDVQDSIGSSGGVRNTAEGRCDIGRIARPLQENEKAYGLVYRFFAYTPVVFVTNRSVALDNITTEQVIALFKGRIDNWRQLGGEDAPLYIAVRYPGDSSRTVLERHIPALREFTDWAGTVTYSTPETVEAVVKHDRTIAFLPLAMAQRHNLNVMRFNGIPPSAATVRSEAYPLIVPLGLVWKDGLRPEAADFVDFVLGEQGKRIIAANGAVPIN